MSLKGNFGTFYIATILQLLGDDQKTGILYVRKGNKEIQVFLQKGIIIYAKGSHTKYQLGRLFRTNGHITEEQLAECLEINRKNNQAIGKILVEKGYISMEMLKNAIAKQAENLIFDLFLWENGEFEYKDANIDLKGLKIVQINTMQILLEATRRIDEMALLKKLIPENRMVFRVTEKETSDEKAVQLDEREKRLLAKVDGLRTVKQIIEDSGYDIFSTYKILNSLILAGRIEKSDDPPHPVLAEKALQEIKNLDPKRLRKEMDQLGFPRSSIIRMVFSRVQRDALTAQELLTSVLRESVKITSPEDIRLLQDLKTGNRMPFLQNTIVLLWDHISTRPS